jgi:hypothetical protein
MVHTAILSKLDGMSDDAFVATIEQQLLAPPRLSPASAGVVRTLGWEALLADPMRPASAAEVRTLYQSLTASGRRGGGIDADFGDVSTEGTTASSSAATQSNPAEGPRMDPAQGSRTAAQIRAEARERVLSQPMLSGTELWALLSRRARRDRIKLERSGALLVLSRDRAKVYPAFQIDREHGRIYPEVERVNKLFSAARDPWGVASWWISPHGRIGAAPMSLLGTADSEHLVALARSIHDDGY